MRRMLQAAFAVSVLVLAMPVGQAATVDPVPTAPDWIDSTFNVEMNGFLGTSIEGRLDVHKLQSLKGQDTAESMRVRYGNALKVSPAAAEDYAKDVESDLRTRVQDTVALAFPKGTITSVTAAVDRASLALASEDAFTPPIVATFTVAVEQGYESYGLKDMTDAKVDAVFDAGAKVTSDFTVSAKEGHFNTYAIAAPAGLAFEVVDGAATASADGRTLTAKTAGIAQTEIVKVKLKSATATPPAAAKASLRVLLDLKDLDVTVAKAAGGDFGNLLIDVAMTGELGAVKLPDSVKGALPASVELTYLSADGMRSLYSAGVIDADDLTSYERSVLDLIDERLGAALGGPVQVAGGFDRATLGAGAKAGAPVVFHSETSVSKPLVGGAPEPQVQAAMSLYSQAIELPLSRIEGYDTTYRVVLPKGLALTEATSDGATITKGEENGRAWFEATPGQESATVRAQIAVTPAFVWAKFSLVIVAAVLLLVLLIAGPIVGVVMVRKRRKAAAGAKK